MHGWLAAELGCRCGLNIVRGGLERFRVFSSGSRLSSAVEITGRACSEVLRVFDVGITAAQRSIDNSSFVNGYLRLLDTENSVHRFLLGLRFRRRLLKAIASSIAQQVILRFFLRRTLSLKLALADAFRETLHARSLRLEISILVEVVAIVNT